VGDADGGAAVAVADGVSVGVSDAPGGGVFDGVSVGPAVGVPVAVAVGGTVVAVGVAVEAFRVTATGSSGTNWLTLCVLTASSL
jgi:hypothetical protein